MILNNFINPIVDKYQKVLANNNIEIAGIEFLEDELGHIFTYDINTNTNYNLTAENYSKKKGMLEIAKFLREELLKIN